MVQFSILGNPHISDLSRYIHDGCRILDKKDPLFRKNLIAPSLPKCVIIEHVNDNSIYYWFSTYLQLGVSDTLLVIIFQCPQRMREEF